MNIFTSSLVIALAVLPASAFCQAPVITISSVAMPADQIMLRQGTSVAFKTQERLSSKTTRTGDRFELISVEDVKIGQHIVIPAGSRGVGEVTNVTKKGAFGKSGKLDTRVLYVTVGDHRLSMAGKSHDQGKGGTVGVVVAAVLLWPVMPFVTGKSAEFPIGTLMNGYVENDLPVAITAATSSQATVAPVFATSVAAGVATTGPIVK